MEYVKQLGADEVLDYRSQPVEELVRAVDVVLEASPLRDNAARVKAVSMLKDGGIFVSVNVDFPFDEAVQTALAHKQATGELSNNQPRQEWLQEMAQLIDAGQVKALISQVYPLAQVADAHRESQTWHVQGKLVLQIRPNDEPA
jgi:NADPH:quinone reductase-like Zn-dependent oxidoreductase